MMAASTHPFSLGVHQETTNKDRYSELEKDLQQVARRLLICGMHVHVGIDDDDLRLDLMGQVSYFLPHLLALSTSSPFWKGNDTGLKSYRISVWDELPRTGLPENFESYTEYRRHVEVLIKAGIIEDATKIWWDIRPSDKFPTLEMRICDISTRLEDTVCIAALYLCWLRMLYRLRRSNQRWRRYARMLVDENRWRAHRYGFDEGLIDFGRGEIIPYTELIDEMLLLIAEDADYFGCVSEVEHARIILQRGTSAHRQLRVYNESLSAGQSQEKALMAVVDSLIEDTRYGLD
jgi:carboxylate-amine ligase